MSVTSKLPKLLPPLTLYKQLLRAHRALPLENRLLGDSYVKSEFKAHKSVADPVQITAFLIQWQKYLISLNTDTWKSETLDPLVLDRLDADKALQLHELMKAAKFEDVPEN